MLFCCAYAQSQGSIGAVGSASSVSEDQQDQLAKAFVMKGWLKFFTYTPNFYASSIPNKFEYNVGYLAQFTWGRNPTFTDKDKDEWGFLNIPDDTHFFFILTRKTLYAMNARRNDIAKTYKSIEMDWIEPTITGDQTVGYKGGLEDIGNFKEGFCFRLKSTTNVIWNICADTMQQKEKWMKTIFGLLENTKQNYQSTGDSLVVSQEIQLPFQINGGKPPIPEYGLPNWISRNGSKIDGRWVILQDWSQCTQICGGGKQYLQRMCVPPQNGGIPCDGDTMLVKDCNTQVCPNVIETTKEGPANPTSIKMQQLSSRPLRYEICVVREGDLDLGITDQGFAAMPKYPVRVILNNKTISIFSTPSYDNVYKSWELNYLNILASPEDKRSCFVLSDLRDSSKKATLCIMPTALKAGQSIEKAKEEWFNDIYFFRDKCKDKNKYVDESPQIKQKRMEVEIEAKNEKFDRIKDKENEDDQKVIQKKVEANTKIALQAVEKENKYEQLAMEEELMREREEENNLNVLVESERDKEACMEREIKKKQKMQSMKKQEALMEDKAEEIQKQASLQVLASRESFKKRMDRLKRTAERKRKNARKAVTEIRTKMAGLLVNDNKVGNYSLCNPTQAQTAMNQYCQTNFATDPDTNKDCVASPEDFCYVCCENEFGRNHMELRDRCYKLCDDVINKVDEQGKGFWTYVPGGNSMGDPATTPSAGAGAATVPTTGAGSF